MTKSLPETADRRFALRALLSAGGLAAAVLAMLMIYSVVLLRIGLSVPATVGLATTLAGISAELVRRATQHSRPRRRRVSRSAVRAAGHSSSCESSPVEASAVT